MVIVSPGGYNNGANEHKWVAMNIFGYRPVLNKSRLPGSNVSSKIWVRPSIGKIHTDVHNL